MSLHFFYRYIVGLFLEYMKLSDEGLHPEKVFKYCPVCGANTLTFKHGRAFMCDTCGFEHFFNAAGAVLAVIVNPKGELLVSRRAKAPFKNTYDLPGGFIDPKESAEESLLREIKEELNVEVDTYELCFTVPNQYPYSGVVIFTVDLVFKVTVKTPEHMKACDDVAEFLWVPPQQLHSTFFGIQSCNVAIQKLGLIP